MGFILKKEYEAWARGAWGSKRAMPGKDAEAGQRGKISQCLGGDMVTVYTPGGDHYDATIAWPYTSGGAMVRVGDGLSRHDMMSVSDPNTEVMWRRVRQK